jgi:hypothetical protein
VEAGEEPTEPNPFADLDTGLPAIDMSGLEAAMAGDFSIADLPAAPPAAPAKKGRTRKAKK